MSDNHAPTSVAEEIHGYASSMAEISKAGAGDISLRAAELHTMLTVVDPDSLTNQELCSLADESLKISRKFEIHQNTNKS